jgi:hypothetical protein
MNENFGIKVSVTFKNGRKETFRNVTEIHYNYRTALDDKRIAFESDIHSTGNTYSISEIEEFETAPETEKQESM